MSHELQPLPGGVLAVGPGIPAGLLGVVLAACAHGAPVPATEPVAEAASSEPGAAPASRTSACPAPPEPTGELSGELEALSFMLGKWRVTETFDPGPMGAGGSGEGEMVAVVGPGGRSIIIDYRSTEGPMRGFELHEIITWAAEDREYHMVYVTSRGGAELSRGAARGDQFVFERESSRDGRRFVSRGVILDVAPSAFAMESHMEADGGPSMRIMRLEYSKR